MVGSLQLIVDGYNVVAPVAPPGQRNVTNWLQRERMLLIGRLVEHLDTAVRSRTCVVFDAANPPANCASRFDIQGMDVRFAVGYPSADDLIEELIGANSAPKQLAVVSSDRRIKTFAERRGCSVFESQNWLDELIDGRVGLAHGAGQGSGDATSPELSDKPESVSDQEDVDDWLRKFGF